MTVPTNHSRVEYEGNDSATEFDYTFKIFDADDLVVILTASDDSETTLVRGTDYSVVGVGNETGGTVTLTGGPLAAGETLTILREIAVVQETDLRNQGAFYPETIEDELDRSRMIDQQQQEQLDRALMKTKGGGDFDADGLRIKNVGSAVEPSDAMNRQDVIDYAQGLESGQVADTAVVNTTTGEQTLSAALDDRVNRGEVGAENVTTPDGTSTVADRFSEADTRFSKQESRFGEYVTPADFGAVGDGVADDSDAVEDALLSGKPVYFGGQARVYRTTRQLNASLTAPLVMRSDGATLLVDSSAAIQYAVLVDMNGHFVYWQGALTTDCQQNSFSGWRFNNPLLANKTSIRISGYRASNCYRADTSFNGGDGLFITGSFLKVSIDDAIVTNVIAATGAIVPGSHGVSGITITRDNTEETDAEYVEVSNFYIANIYSEDSTETADQDGLKVFSVYNNAETIPTQAVANVHHGKFKNCNGRSVKLQMEWGSVTNVMCVRDGPHNVTGNPEIDFQTGGGYASDIKCFYRSNFPSRVFNFSLRRAVGRLNPTTASIDNVVVEQYGGGSGVERISAASTVYNGDYAFHASGVQLYGAKIPTYGFTIQGPTTATFTTMIDRYQGRASDSVLRRLGGVMEMYATGLGITLFGTGVKFYEETSAGSSTVSVLGANRNVSAQ